MTKSDRRSFGVFSEVGQLRQVILHGPGLELSRLTPQNIAEMLFDGVVWVAKARAEHDAFAESLRGQEASRSTTSHNF